MYLTYLALGLPLLAGAVSAHGFVESWVIDGTSYDGFQPSWIDRFENTAERPTDNKDHGWAEPDDPIVACGGMSPGTDLDTWTVNEGSSISANWDNWPKAHMGPVMEYMAACPTGSCDGVDAFSLEWFKISEEGWENDQWATDKLNQTSSWSFTIPKGIESGAYLVRHEIIAMHFPGKPQVYPVCFQANVVSSGSGSPNEMVTFPDAYAEFDQGFKQIDVWWRENPTSPDVFVPPGSRVASLDSSTSPSDAAASLSHTSGKSVKTSSPIAEGVVTIDPSSVVATSLPSTAVDQPSPVQSDLTSTAGSKDTSGEYVEPSPSEVSSQEPVTSVTHPETSASQSESSAPVDLPASSLTNVGDSSASPSTTGRGSNRGGRSRGSHVYISRA